MERKVRDSMLCNIYSIVNILYHSGIYLEIGDDFKKYKEIVSRNDEKQFPHPAFDYVATNIDKHFAFWIIGRLGDCSLVHTQAMKYYDMRGFKFRDFLTKNISDFGIHNYNHDYEKTEIYLTSSAENIQRGFTYHGELWIKGGPNGLRGGCAAALLTRLAITISILKWSPAFLIGFQSPKTACRGLSCKEGYMRVEQRSFIWTRESDETPHEDWLVWMDINEAIFNMRVNPYLFLELFGLEDLKTIQKKTEDLKVA